ncbi:winged helix-turn-helix domain-containing protein [Roseomonas sp. BN140053]|uniref:winged helix-turn-helix domain-containing protein n=1 Tax=Roseomonas sp. BN140053 TaxID=3391898 RepID=UPI0039EB0B1B
MASTAAASGGERVVDESAYHFDAFRLDPRRGVLEAEDGTVLPLRPRSYELLRHMLDRPHELLRREALLEALWPGLAVTDDSLTQCISELRQAFGSRGSAVLRTLPRRGYVLAANVRREAPPADPPTAPAAARPTPTLAAAPGRDLLVIEALEPASADAAGQQLARALGAELLVTLSRSEIMRVLTRRPVPAPADCYRLCGAMLRAGEEPLLSLVLEDAETSRVLWADRVALPAGSGRDDALAVLLARLEMHVTGEALHRARHKAPEARRPHDFILLGRELHERGGEANTLEARQHFLRAIAMDPSIAVAHAFHAFTVIRFLTHGWGGGDRDVQCRLALDIAQRAVELEPRSALCQSALAFALLHLGRWEEAVEAARASLRLSSLSAIGTRTACAEVLAASGEAAEAAAALQAAIALDPFCPPRSRAVLGRALLLSGRREEALAELHRADARLPDYAPCLRSMVVAAVELGRMEEARDALARLRRLQPNWLPNNRQALAFLRDERDLERFVAAFEACADAVNPAS